MNSFISLLRGVNVTGYNKLLMADLKSLYESLDFKNVVTYLQSGNVVCDSNQKDASTLSSIIEMQIKKTFDLNVSVLIRNKNDLQGIITSNPFIKRKEDPTKLHVTFLHSLPTDLQKLSALPDGPDECVVINKEIFLFCPNGYGRTKLSNNFFENKLNVIATTRNWNTVNALYKLVSER